MGRRSVILFLTVQVLSLMCSHPRGAAGDLLGTVTSPNFDQVCRFVDCGKGTCRQNSNTTWKYECECDAGWHRPFQEADRFQYLPCVIPNCTFSYDCSNRTGVSPPPVGPPSPSPSSDNSIIDPCAWTLCGGGTCTRTTPIFGYRCDCREGYVNLFDSTKSPCVRECALGTDCADLKITLRNATTLPGPAGGGPRNGAAAARSSPGGLLWITLLMLSAAMAVRT